MPARHLDAGNSLERKTTTQSPKDGWGTRLIAEPNGKKVSRLDNPQSIPYIRHDRTWERFNERKDVGVL